MYMYIITVNQLVDDNQLDYDDNRDNPKGQYALYADNLDDALDKFHSNYAIAVLDDFEIIVDIKNKESKCEP